MARRKKLFTTPRKPWRIKGFFLSYNLHLVVFIVLVSGSDAVRQSVSPKPPEQKYSVLVLHLDDFRPIARPQVRAASGSASAGAPAAGNKTLQASEQAAADRQSFPGEQDLADSISPQEPGPRRPFVLPPVPKKSAAKQTLVQPDLPSDLALKQEIPLPTALLWEPPPPVRKKFIAPPPAEKPHVLVEVPTAPELSPPNKEILTADLKIASIVPTRYNRLFRPPAKTAPVKGRGIQPISEPPQIAALTPADANLTALISLPDSPVISGETIAIPPANQIAPSGSGGSGRSGSATGTSGQQGNRSSANGSSGSSGPSGSSSSSGPAGTGTTGGATAKGGSGSSASGQSSSSAGLNRGSGGAESGTGAAPADGATPGKQTALVAGRISPNAAEIGNAGTAPGGDVQLIPGTTRISLPADGKFGVIVSGSSLAAPYAETAGALSGKMVYSVYISVGLRKKWILQYCLLRSEEQKTTIKGAAAQRIDAPWPYQITRPDTVGNSNGDYVIIHGLLTSEGRFDQLGLVFPAELPSKELLMSSLRQWTFRPASRDGVPSPVEVLLIIPSQAD